MFKSWDYKMIRWWGIIWEYDNIGDGDGQGYCEPKVERYTFPFI